MDIENVNLNEIDIEEVVELEVDVEQIGPRGLSAYEVYLQNGGTLSETDWLLSLKGEKGDTGEKGEKGDNGDLSQEHLDERTGLPSNLNTINKDNLVNAINEVNDSYIGDDIGVTYINLTSYDYSGSPSESFVSEEKNKMTKLINDLYRSKSKFTHLYLQRMIPYNFGKENQTQQSSNNLILDFGLCDVSMQSKQYLWYGDQIQGYNSFEKTYWSVGHEYVKLTITGTWTDNVFTCTSASIYRGSGLGRNWVKPASQSSLSNYLSKTNTTEYVPTSSYHPVTKVYVDQSINDLKSQILQFNILIVDVLPIENISINTIYLVPKKSDEEDNVYYEYLYINNKWEKIGDTKIDLSNYATKEYVENTAVLKIYDGREIDYDSLSQEEKDNYDVAILYPLVELDESQLLSLSNILGENTETTSDMTEPELEEQLNEIIGGE